MNGTGDAADVYTYAGESALDTAEVAGIAIRDTTTGAWTYAYATWSTLNGAVSTPNNCAGSGADTVGVYDDFHRFTGLLSTIGAPVVGDLLMLFRETTFKFQTSVMDNDRDGAFSPGLW